MEKHRGDNPKTEAQLDKLIAVEDAQWATRAEAAKAQGGYLGPEKSMKSLLDLLHGSAAAGKRKPPRKL